MLPPFILDPPNQLCTTSLSGLLLFKDKDKKIYIFHYGLEKLIYLLFCGGWGVVGKVNVKRGSYSLVQFKTVFKIIGKQNDHVLKRAQRFC